MHRCHRCIDVDASVHRCINVNVNVNFVNVYVNLGPGAWAQCIDALMH